ncbi:MAG: thioredoxin family protein [Planctomycetota bacterium]|jgi:thiol-disulfide isomerase/thioredoxin/YHS domain-containing protein
MQRPKILPILLWSVIALTLANFGFGKDTSEIAWSEDLAGTMELAQRTGKPVLIHFYGDHCPPCRMLEKKAFKDTQLIAAISEHVLAVRINAERDTKTAARFRVNRWPTDVYLHPNGEEIYRNISAQDPSAYERTVLKVAEKNQRFVGQHKSKPSKPLSEETNTKVRASFASGRPMTAEASSPVAASLQGPARVRLSEVAIASVDTADVAINNQTPLPTLAGPSVQDMQPLVVEAPLPTMEVASDAVASDAVASDALASDAVASDAVTPPTTQPPTKVEPILPTEVAMGGFCPVTLAMAIEASKTGTSPNPAWVKGNGDFAVRHRGRVYHCVSEEALAKFLESPDLFAPVLSGCDLVEYSKSGKWIDGDCRFGFIDKETGRIFLFSSSLNCQEFVQNCESYSSMVGKPTQR